MAERDSSPESGEIAGQTGPALLSGDGAESGGRRGVEEGGEGGRAESGVRRQSKKKRKLVEEGKGSAADYFDVYGPDARGSVEMVATPGHPIKLSDVNGLVTWVIGEGTNPRWAFVKNKPLVNRVVLLLISGIDTQLLQQAEAQLSNLSRIFPAHVDVSAPNPKMNPSNAARVLLTCPLPKNKAKRKRQRTGMHKAPFPPSYYTLTLKEMEDHGYPVPSLSDGGELLKPAGYEATLPDEDAVNGSSAVLMGLDCEMCITAAGLELTRVTLVNEHDTVVVDELVKPSNPILDYNTRFSGITEDMLSGVTTSLEDARAKVIKVVKDTTMLVGHGLDNDLRALRLLHANCLDTSILYPHPKGPPARSALRYLSDKFLKRPIQQGSHDSLEDAKAALDLVKLKIKHGPGWGIERQEVELLVHQLSEAGQRCSLVDSPGSLHKWVTGGANAVAVHSDEETIAKMCAEARNEKADFVWGHLTGLSSLYAARAAERRAAGSKGVVVDVSATSLKSSNDAKTKAKSDVEKESETETEAGEFTGGSAGDSGEHDTHRLQLPQVLSDCNKRLGELWEGLLPNTLLIVATGHGDTAEAQRAEESKWRRSQEEPLDGLPRWTAGEEAKLQAVVARVTKGLCFAAVKQ